ncbi:MAG TPA: integration host factor subunit beta, partial [Planctomycetes bacterium]|nr:integration host factor subunit beta [Planctomycetota bacterium]
PRTGARVDVPAKFVVTFKPGKEMEERVKHLDQPSAAETEAPAAYSPPPISPAAQNPPPSDPFGASDS